MTTKTKRRPRVLVLEGLSGAARIVRLAGGEPITVDPRDVGAVDRALKAGFEALLLTGGGDVDPRQYGEKPHKRTYGVNETRDLTEWCALAQAAALDVPVLGICRGSQIMAVHNGGKLRQHITGHRNTAHLVFAQPGTLFKRVVGKAMPCVSLHHQVVRRHGDAFRVAARNREGMIEAIESRDGRCLGVQFHPEMDYFRNAGSRAIFRWLVEEAAKRAGIEAPKAAKLPKPQAPRQGQLPLPEAWQGNHRPAGTRTQPGRRKKAPVKVSWLCPDCGIRFDNQKDREDHIWHLHEREQLFGTTGEPPTFLGVQEPPADHPDWEGAS